MTFASNWSSKDAHRNIAHRCRHHRSPYFWSVGHKLVQLNRYCTLDTRGECPHRRYFQAGRNRRFWSPYFGKSISSSSPGWRYFYFWTALYQFESPADRPRKWRNRFSRCSSHQAGCPKRAILLWDCCFSQITQFCSQWASTSLSVYIFILAFMTFSWFLLRVSYSKLCCWIIRINLVDIYNRLSTFLRNAKNRSREIYGSYYFWFLSK